MATQSKASTSTGISEMEDVESPHVEARVFGIQADSSDVFVQDAHHDAVDEEQPSVFACCL
ncbi:unnamed protein product [Symbiodinium natans]|uniref:Uncharacterized protein n=1 Tax=Symbiodinium natans TaxID=878477 RepID=A0A812S074_9DINO|nr:unnamed protein product [Symbiodinium natans]